VRRISQKKLTPEQINKQLSAVGGAIKRNKAYQILNRAVDPLTAYSAFAVFLWGLSGFSLNPYSKQFAASQRRVEASQKIAYEKLAKEPEAKKLLEAPIGRQGDTLGHFFQSSLTKSPENNIFTVMVEDRDPVTRGIDPSKTTEFLTGLDRLLQGYPPLNADLSSYKKIQEEYKDYKDAAKKRALGGLGGFILLAILISTNLSLGSIFKERLQRRRGRLLDKEQQLKSYLPQNSSQGLLLRASTDSKTPDTLLRPAALGPTTDPTLLLRAAGNDESEQPTVASSGTYEPTQAIPEATVPVGFTPQP